MVQLSYLSKPGPLWAATWLHLVSEALDVCPVMLSSDKSHVALVPQFCSEVKLCNASYTNCRCQNLPTLTSHHITFSQLSPLIVQPAHHISPRVRSSTKKQLACHASNASSSWRLCRLLRIGSHLFPLPSSSAKSRQLSTVAHP